ncbi:hypothetical protein SCLCIDRAFT_791352 [Scleroderma citrinum Foug A]|uniref:Uncharacterized protein n=1 Tax=Scleroderma citrinum Foug A TaxID=1036808 RepID=A0A0C3E2M7_9AGAM|nr:hypothetical protein SCLCIDRAFT_791352 [Scleroderma citrinum Foug A]
MRIPSPACCQSTEVTCGSFSLLQNSNMKHAVCMNRQLIHDCRLSRNTATSNKVKHAPRPPKNGHHHAVSGGTQRPLALSNF